MDHNSGEHESDSDSRRGFLQLSTTTMMASGIAGGYGLLAVHAGRYLYPADPGAAHWQFVCTLDQLAVGESMPFELPSGVKLVVARHSAEAVAEAFIALSSVCPHLGCQVHWEALNDRFFCPCHNGAFDASGQPTEGPPAKANQFLTRFPLRVEGNLLMIEVPLEAFQVPDGEAAG